MRKSYKLLGLLLGAVLACGGMFGCQSNSTPSANEITVGSTYNTLKVLRDGTYPDLGKNLAISMAKGETEGAQLMVTPKRAVGAYNVTVSDLVGENGAKIDKSAVKVYVQKYLEVTNKTAKQTNTDYPIGFYPDMLLPVDLAVEYGENTIGAGHNQAFTVEVTTTAETQAGDYAGTVTVMLDGKTETVQQEQAIGNPNFLQELQNGQAFLYATFDNSKVGAALSVNVDGDGKSYITVEYKNLTIMRAREQSTMDAL